MTSDPFSFPGIDPLILEESDLGLRALFQSFQPGNTNPFQRGQFSSLFQPTFNQFLGQLGSQIKGGEAPTQTFTSFLESDLFNPQRELLRLPNQSRGGGNGGGGGGASPTLFRFNR